MSGEERLSGRLRATLRNRRNAVVLQDRLDRVPRDLVAETLQVRRGADTRYRIAGRPREGYHCTSKRGVETGTQVAGPAASATPMARSGTEPPFSVARPWMRVSH